MASRLYLDVNVLIAAYETDGAASDLIWQLFDEAASTERFSLVTSELSLSEMLVKPCRDDAKDLQALYRALPSTSLPILFKPVSLDVLFEAARMRAARPQGSGARPVLPDFIHAATAVLEDCSMVLTADSRFPAPPSMRVVEVDETSLAKLLDVA